MATIKLTDKTVAAARAEEGQRLELWDEQTPGLCLRVSDTGKKVWIWRYRTADGRQPRFTLGDYSTRSGLKWAREQVEDLRVSVRRGADPAADRRKERASARAQPIRTFDDLADAYLKACENGNWQPKGKRKRDRSIADDRGSLKRHVRPVIGGFRLEEITRSDVRSMLREMVGKGIGAQTNKAHAVVRQCFAYAIAEERLAMNPATGFAKLAPQVPRVRVLTDAELKAFWHALQSPTGLRLPAKPGAEEGVRLHIGRPMAIAIELSLLLLQRRGEIAGMMLSELELDQGVWLIPGERMKNGFPHMVPLPARAVALVREAMTLAEQGLPEEDRKRVWAEDRPIFPSPRDKSKPIKPDSITHAVVGLAAAVGIKDATPHDLRRTGSTVLTSERLGVSPFIRSKVLGHRGDTGGGAAVSAAHYDANSYASEKRRALVAWDGLLMEIVTGVVRANNVHALNVGG